MPEPFPPELRLALLVAHRREPELSVRALAKRFGLSPSTVSRWLRRWSSERNLAPRSHPPSRAIPDDHAEWLRHQVPQVRRLQELAEAYAAWSGTQVHPSTLSRALKRWGIAPPRRHPQGLWILGWGLGEALLAR